MPVRVSVDREPVGRLTMVRQRCISPTRPNSAEIVYERLARSSLGLGASGREGGGGRRSEEFTCRFAVAHLK